MNNNCDYPPSSVYLVMLIQDDEGLHEVFIRVAQQHGLADCVRQVLSRSRHPSNRHPGDRVERPQLPASRHLRIEMSLQSGNVSKINSISIL